MPDRFHGIARQLLTCYQAQLLAEGADAPAIITMRAGEVVGQFAVSGGGVVDECCAGLAWVRIVRFFPTDTFPEEREGWTPCGPTGWALVLEMGALRCAPVGTPEHIPTDAEWSAAVQLQMKDAAAMLRAVDCCFQGLVISEQVQLSPWEERAPEGLCMGGTQQVTVLVDYCNGC